jgi:hypothetical protein
VGGSVAGAGALAGVVAAASSAGDGGLPASELDKLLASTESAKKGPDELDQLLASKDDVQKTADDAAPGGANDGTNIEE